MKGFYKKQIDGALHHAIAIYGPGISINEDNKQEYDGWKWFGSETDAYEYHLANDTNKIQAWQFKLILKRYNQLAAFINFVNATLDANEKEKLQYAWDNNAQFKKTSPILVAFAASKGWTQQQIDTMFEQAMALTV